MIARALVNLVVVLGVALGHSRPAVAQPTEPRPIARPLSLPSALPGPVTLLEPTAPWRWQLVTAPPIASQLGALAVSGIDAVAGRGPLAPVLGEPVPEPAGWPYTIEGTARTLPVPAADQRIAAAFGVTTFALARHHEGLEVLELRLRYQDGVAVWLNGVEVVRRALPRDGTTGLAARPHGPEWETFYVPVAPGLLRLGVNVLAVEVHPSGRRTAPTLEAVLRGRRDRGILRGPVIAELGITTATIAVETDPGITATLEWGLGDVLEQRQSTAAGHHHRFELANLPANADVHYRVLAGAGRSERYTFHTMPAPGAVIRIGVYGDVRGGHAVHRELVGQMLREGLDVVGVTGDMVLHGADEADWQRFFAVTRELLAQVPYYPAVGNHDLGWDGAHDTRRAEAVFALPDGPPGRPAGTFWYSRDLADLHLVFLDSNAYVRLEQEAWLEADLAAARARHVRAILVFTHDGPYSRGHHGGSAIARDRYVPILLRHRVDLVMSGHDHLYQRGELGGLRYLVSGGGGASLYGIRCGVPGRPTCTAEDGTVIVAREHHYIVLTIGRDVEVCTRRPDGTLLEPCVRYPLLR
ncbi:MAG: metallophosphoesterase [Deltaproteobacteria bacterium]|nr:metallophosphoesterase [Deltaproteobacteria bacterium]